MGATSDPSAVATLLKMDHVTPAADAADAGVGADAGAAAARWWAWLRLWPVPRFSLRAADDAPRGSTPLPAEARLTTLSRCGTSTVAPPPAPPGAAADTGVAAVVGLSACVAEGAPAGAAASRGSVCTGARSTAVRYVGGVRGRERATGAATTSSNNCTCIARASAPSVPADRGAVAVAASLVGASAEARIPAAVGDTDTAVYCGA